MTDEPLDELTRELPLSGRIANTAFAHPSERVAAQILDYYRIEWEYEPDTFPLEWDKQGNVLASFSPDFHLPEFDLYIELTTMSQKLVTKKNRKVRRLKELYPDVSIKVLYQRDFRKLLFKYGIPVVSREHAAGGGLEAAERDHQR
ncbi:MAG: PDDEXK family nuclease [Coriobacteriia bacterium]